MSNSETTVSCTSFSAVLSEWINFVDFCLLFFCLILCCKKSFNLGLLVSCSWEGLSTNHSSTPLVTLMVSDDKPLKGRFLSDCQRDWVQAPSGSTYLECLVLSCTETCVPTITVLKQQSYFHYMYSSVSWMCIVDVNRLREKWIKRTKLKENFRIS